jgi:hypothetical protein
MEAESAAGTGMSQATVLQEHPEAVRESQRWIIGATWFFVALGILLRLVRYLVDYPIWHDEAFLACSLWDRDYVALLRPLDYGQIAPWLFLAIERTIVIGLGYSELTLRLFPTICSVLSVLLFHHVGRRLLGRKAQLLAVAIFATSFYLIRHGAEIKPYASDLLASLILVALAVEAARSPASSRWLWILAAVVPVLVAVSYPAVFVAGGIGLALAPQALGSGRRPTRLAWVVYNLLLVSAFVSVYLSSAVFQAAAMREDYRNGCWAESFPPIDRPWMMPIWLLDIHTGTMMAYPAGDKHGASTGTLLCVIAGCLALSRQGRKSSLALLLAPFALGLIAACLGRYPYGGAPRIMLYLAPAICLLAGLGLADLLDRIRPQRLHRLVPLGILAALSILGSGLIVRDLAKPYRMIEDVRTRDFARWFWSEYAPHGEVVCLKSDIGLPFRPKLWRVGMSAVYLFHQRMYSDRVRNRRPVNLDPDHHSESHPLLLVAFDHLPTYSPGYQQWLGAVSRRYELRRTETYVIQPGKPEEDWLRDAYVVLEFVPRTADARHIARGSSAGRARVRF